VVRNLAKPFVWTYGAKKDEPQVAASAQALPSPGGSGGWQWTGTQQETNHFGPEVGVKDERGHDVFIRRLWDLLERPEAGKTSVEDEVKQLMRCLSEISGKLAERLAGNFERFH
jgi:hypothetical protein